MRTLPEALADLVAPSRCAVRGCLQLGPLCPGCAAKLRHELRFGPVMALPTPCPPGLPPTWAAGDYAGVLRRVITQHKDGRRADLTALLAKIIRPVLQAVPQDALVVVVPTTPRARARRGGHPLDDAVRMAAGLKCIRPLVWARTPEDQSTLGARERHQNLHGTLLCTALPTERPIVIVDDVLTTGSTMAEAARAMIRAGGDSDRLHAVVIAATRRRNVLLKNPLREPRRD